MVFSPDGRRLLTHRRRGVERDSQGCPRTDLKIPFLSKPEPPGMIPTPIGRRTKPLPFTPARIWDVETGKQLAALRRAVLLRLLQPQWTQGLTADSEQTLCRLSGTGRSLISGRPRGNCRPSSAFTMPPRARNCSSCRTREVSGRVHGDGRRVLDIRDRQQIPNKDIKVWDAESGTLLFASKRAARNGWPASTPKASGSSSSPSGIRIRRHERQGADPL